MGIVGRFIDAVCDTHPHLMRAVLDKPLSPLIEWVHWDDSGQTCGCLIGTAAIAAGFTPMSEDDIDVAGCDAVTFLARSTGIDDGYLDRIGRTVYEIARRIAAGKRGRRWEGATSTPASDARVVHLIRQRIARQLAVRESAMVGVALLPNEPVETPLRSAPR